MSLDDQIQQLSETIVGELRAPIEASLRQLIGETFANASRERDEAVARAAAADQRRETELAALQAEAEQRLHESVEAARSAARAEAQEALDALRDSAEADKALALAEQKTELERAHAGELAMLREGSATEVAAAISQARAEVAEQRDVGAAAWHAEREDLLRRHEAHLAALDQQHRAELEDARATLAGELDSQAASIGAQAALEREAAIRAALDQAAREREQALARLREGGEDARAAAHETLVGQRQADLACSERLLDAVRQLDSGRSLREVLATLTDCVAGEAGRCALLLAENGRLRGWRLAGFPGLGPSDLEFPLEEAGALAAAAAGGQPVSTAPGTTDDLPALLLAPGGRVGLALPLLVGQRAVAVLYADDAGVDRPVAPSNWPEVAEVLVRHAGRCLEVMTIARVAGPIGQRVLPPLAAQPQAATLPGAEEAAVPPVPQDGPDSDVERQAESAQRYARLLLSEVKLYNESAVEEGRRDGNLLARLGPEIERARRLYEEKIPAVVRERVDWFDQELVRTLAGGDAALLGQVT